MPSWKVAIIAGWFVVAFALFTADPTPMIGYAKLGFWLTLAAHVLEFAVFRKTFEKAEGSMPEHFLMTLALGMFHIQDVKTQTEAGDA
jgi:uncharacterized protein YhhL (DUF1145 family)